MKRIFTFIILSIICVSVFADIYTTIYTKGGQAIHVILKNEYSDKQIQDLNDEYRLMFPRATFLSTATRTYNCHSYAWNISDGDSIYCWIDQNAFGEPNISKYWTNDYYSETTESKAVKVFYYNSDHSAIVSPTVKGMYESKWGAAPLMRHAPNYGPYEKMNERKYYYHEVPMTEYGLICTSYGVGTIGINIAASYWAEISNCYGLTMVCVIETGKGDDAVEEGYAIINKTSDSSVNVTFTRPGIYEMTMRFYNKFNELVGEYNFQPLVTR